MVQVKITGVKHFLNSIKPQLSEIVHSCLQDTIGTPENKKFQRFFPLEPENFFYPSDRTSQYTLIEIVMFEAAVPNSKIRTL